MRFDADTNNNIVFEFGAQSDEKLVGWPDDIALPLGIVACFRTLIGKAVKLFRINRCKALRLKVLGE
jgi:hypothetical protein